jgi:hypothetical protein
VNSSLFDQVLNECRELRQILPKANSLMLARVYGESFPVMYLLAVFLLLFTAWMFLGWMYGESRDVRWLRNWCAGIFVLMATLICLGGGAVFARRATQASCRASLEQFAKLLEERVEEGRIQDVRDAISHLANRPEEWSSHSPDILTRINEVTQALEKTSLNKVATKTAAEKTAL